MAELPTRKISILSRVFGPELTLSGNSRHIVALNRIFQTLPISTYGDLIRKLDFFLTVDGRFSKDAYAKPIRDGVRRCRFDKDGSVWVDVGISLETVLCTQFEFRERLLEIIRQCAISLNRYMDRKNIGFNAELFSLHVELVLQSYADLELPLDELPGDRAVELYVSGELPLPSNQFGCNAGLYEPID